MALSIAEFIRESVLRPRLKQAGALVVLGIAKPEVMADLGYGVMDDAMVEAAAYVLEKQP